MARSVGVVAERGPSAHAGRGAGKRTGVGGWGLYYSNVAVYRLKVGQLVSTVMRIGLHDER